VQRAAQILAQLPQHLALLHATARRTYSAWTAQLERPALFQLGALPGAAAGCLPPDDSRSNTALTLQYQAQLATQT
ncbi:MAG: hypothetical protein RR100_15180, partial [Comamonas sp.]